MEACSQGAGDKSTNKETVFFKKDDQGRIVERWGNEKIPDNDINFRYFFHYDSLGRLTDEKQYHFDDDNASCTIIDSLDFILVEYVYNDQGEKLLEKKYFPTYDKSSGKVIGHKLGYIYHVDSGLEEVVN